MCISQLSNTYSISQQSHLKAFILSLDGMIAENVSLHKKKQLIQINTFNYTLFLNVYNCLIW